MDLMKLKKGETSKNIRDKMISQIVDNKEKISIVVKEEPIKSCLNLELDDKRYLVVVDKEFCEN